MTKSTQVIDIRDRKIQVLTDQVSGLKAELKKISDNAAEPDQADEYLIDFDELAARAMRLKLISTNEATGCSTFDELLDLILIKLEGDD